MSKPKRPTAIIYDDVQPAAWPEHKWDRVLLCVYCGTSTISAQLLQPDTQGAGPCEERRKQLLEHQRELYEEAQRNKPK